MEAVAAALTRAGIPSHRTSLDGGGSGILDVDQAATAAVYGVDARVELIWSPRTGWSLAWGGDDRAGRGSLGLKIGSLPAPQQVVAAVQPMVQGVPVLDFTSPSGRADAGRDVLAEAQAAYPCDCQLRQPVA